jgi:hypothetical protein
MLAHVEQPPRRPSEVDPTLPEVVDDTVLKALEKDPEKRFQSAQVFRCALESVKDVGRLYTGHTALAANHAGNGTPRPEQPTISRPQEPALRSAVNLIPLPIRRSPLAKAAAVLVCALLLSYAWVNAFPGPNTQASLPDFAALPITWPANLILLPQLTIAEAHTRLPRPAMRKRGNAIMVTDENGLRREIRSEPKNPFVRAMDHVVHPFRHRPDADNRSTAAARVSTGPRTN